MAKEKFVLVSLKEDKAKQLAQVIANESCRKILDYLAEKEATETELAEKLQIPISTVHYNLKHLMDGGLVTVDEFHYSEKGKEVNHYKLANKYIIIAPKTTYGIKEKLKTILPVALLAAVGAGFVQLYTQYFGAGAIKSALMQEAAREAPAVMEEAVTAAKPMMDKLVEEAAMTAAEEAPAVAAKAAEAAAAAPNYALWFLVGAVFAIVLYLIVSKIRER